MVKLSHVWLGLTAGVFICLMGFTGGLVALKRPIASLLSPPASGPCVSAIDWDKAAGDIASFAHADINRVYGPLGADMRYHFRMATENPILFKHVIYDACAGRVLGSIEMAWMDWLVDLHHNLLNGRAGRRWTGAIGIAMLLSSFGGALLWLTGNPNWRTAFRVHWPLSRRTPRELHRAFGLVAACMLTVEAATGLWLAFPQTMRSLVTAVAAAPESVRPGRGSQAAEPAQKAGLGELMSAARRALPGGRIREIRMPEGGGAAQIRMWLPGDFRDLGNNVVYVSGADARVIGVDRYAERSGPAKFTQAVAGMHYDEWGGPVFLTLAAVAGLSTPLLFLTGFLLWRQSRPRRSAKAQASAPEPADIAAA